MELVACAVADDFTPRGDPHTIWRTTMKAKTTSSLHGARLATIVGMALTTACAGDPPQPPTGPGAPTTPAVAAGGTVQCKESNSCKGKASCTGVAGGEKHGCKGSNKCANNLRELSKAECDNIHGTVVAAK
jgi:hypothetical protein